MLNTVVFCSLFVANCLVSSEFVFGGFDYDFKPEWWQSNIIYQVYVRSFKDSNGDGIGDLNGITEKVGYFKSLNVGAVWLSPIFKSPQDDFGYDTSNYKEIDPLFGTMKDFERLRTEFHNNDIKLILDFVPNHTSDEHPWFKKSVRKIEPYSNYYVWVNPINGTDGKRRPPNNWLNYFNSGSAWEWNEQRGQYYYHAFQKKQPDLNYRNPMVVEEIKNTVSYWMGRGVDGFRFDAVSNLYEHKDLLDEKRSYAPDAYETDYDYLTHTSTVDQPETYEMVKIWRKLVDTESDEPVKTSKFFMVECDSLVDKVMGYYGNETAPGAHFPINFLFIHDLNQQSDAYAVINVIKSWMNNMPKKMWPNWVLGNHDHPRMATRINPMLMDGLHMMQFLLPGTPITYYADELGMQNTYVRWDQSLDPAGRNVGLLRYTKFSRDPVRSPFPWDASPNAGFTSGPKTWLPVNPEYWHENLEVQFKTRSHLQTYRQLTRLKQQPTIIKGDLHVYALNKWVFGFSRSYRDHPTIFVVINFGSERETVNIKAVRPTLPEIMKIKISSINSGVLNGDLMRISNVVLRPKAALVLTTARQNEDMQ